MANKKPGKKKQAVVKEHNPYNKIFRENIGKIFLPLVEKSLGLRIEKTEELKDKLQTTLEREADFLRLVTPENGQPFVLHLEFQTNSEPDMVYRMQEYHAILRRKYGYRYVSLCIFWASLHLVCGHNSARKKYIQALNCGLCTIITISIF
jgi:hypothetical protein